MIGIVTGAAIAEADVEIAVGAEREVAAVVIGEWLRDEGGAAGAVEAQIEPGCGVGDEGTSSAGIAPRPCCRSGS